MTMDPEEELLAELNAALANPSDETATAQALARARDYIQEVIDDHLNSEPCDAQIHTWSVFNSNATDPYWMRCDLLGPHTDHENSETGATWPNENAPALAEAPDQRRDPAWLTETRQTMHPSMSGTEAIGCRHTQGGSSTR